MASAPGVVLAQALAAGTRRFTESEWFGSAPHRLLLSRPKAEGLAANPRDLRPASAERGRQLLAGAFQLAGAAMRVGPEGDPWDRAYPTRRFAVALHRFGWMGDLLAAGEEGARTGLRYAADWRRTFGRWNAFSWSPEVLERRVFNLACAARRLTARASEAETAAFAADLARQARHLLMIGENPGRTAERAAAAAVAGCALAGPAGERLIGRALKRLERELPLAVLADGGHASRSPQAGLELLFDLLALDDALHQRGLASVEEVSRAIDRLTDATRFFTLADGRLAAFQGGEELEAAYIAAALAHDDGERRPAMALPHARYQKLEGAGLQIIADAGAPAKGRWSTTACAQPLALEVLRGRDRLITGCAWSPGAHAPPALRLTDGASTASLGDLSCGAPLRGFRAQALGGRLAQGPDEVEARRHDAEAGVWVEMSHDGWLRRFGLVHERRLYLDQASGELRGEDAFRPLEITDESENAPRRYAPFSVRFHLHPEAGASLARDRKSVLIRGPDEGFWLRNDAVEVAVEPSVRLLDGEPRRTTQVVLRGQVRLDKGGRVRWKLSAAES